MTIQKIDLKKEQTATLKRSRYPYSWTARLFFKSMDWLTGKQITLSKAKLIETLASIPYRAWEIRQYAKLTRKYKNQNLVNRARIIMEWGREAQDNEYWHLLVINEKMKEEGIKDAWYLFPLIPLLMTYIYFIISRSMALFNIQRAFLFNAEFEDHAEHVYAQFVHAHPEWEKQPVNNDIVNSYGNFNHWADVFRRIGLDERDHMNHSLYFYNQPDDNVKYEGMPELPD